MDIQRLRNLTTRKLHTDISHVYRDLEWMIGEEGLMTHMLPRVLDSVAPWLKKVVTEPRFWDGKYDPTHTGEFDLPEPSRQERIEMLNRYQAMPDPLQGKNVVVIKP